MFGVICFYVSTYTFINSFIEHVSSLRVRYVQTRVAPCLRSCFDIIPVIPCFIGLYQTEQLDANLHDHAHGCAQDIYGTVIREAAWLQMSFQLSSHHTAVVGLRVELISQMKLHRCCVTADHLTCRVASSLVWHPPICEALVEFACHFSQLSFASCTWLMTCCHSDMMYITQHGGPQEDQDLFNCPKDMHARARRAMQLKNSSPLQHNIMPVH